MADSIDGCNSVADWYPASDGGYGELYSRCGNVALDKIELRLMLFWPDACLLLGSGSSCGTGVGALAVSCKYEPGPGGPFPPGAIAIGLKRRNDPEVLAATLKESEAVPNDDLLFQFVFETVALFFAIGKSSPSVPSSYPDVFPPWF